VFFSEHSVEQSDIKGIGLSARNGFNLNNNFAPFSDNFLLSG